jgi:hypothetical protein
VRGAKSEARWTVVDWKEKQEIKMTIIRTISMWLVIAALNVFQTVRPWLMV